MPYDQSEIKEIIIDIICDYNLFEPSDIRGSDALNFEALEIDEIDKFCIIIDLEEKLHIRIPDEKIFDNMTVDDLTSVCLDKSQPK